MGRFVKVGTLNFGGQTLYGLLDTLGTLLEAYGEEHHPLPESNGAEMLRYFMQEHNLSQSDLTKVVSQGIPDPFVETTR